MSKTTRAPGPYRETLYGRQPVRELLRAGRRKVHKVYLQGEARASAELDEIRRLVRRCGCALVEVGVRQLDHMVDGHHQGAAAKVSPYPYVEGGAWRPAAEDATAPLLLALDHIQDPQNLGSLLRSADAAGVDAVLVPRDRAAGVTPAAVRASAGAAEHVRVARVTNLVRELRALRDNGLVVTGLENRPEALPYTRSDLAAGVVLVVGSEGRGLGRLVRETCDALIRLPLHGRVASLNAAVAGAIALYEARRQREAADQGRRLEGKRCA